MPRDFSEINEKLKRASGNMQPTQEQWRQFEEFAERYKDRDQAEIEAEMNRLLSSFSRAEKEDLVQKLTLLKQMGGLLDSDQKRKVDFFIQLLSR